MALADGKRPEGQRLEVVFVSREFGSLVRSGQVAISGELDFREASLGAFPVGASNNCTMVCLWVGKDGLALTRGTMGGRKGRVGLSLFLQLFLG